MKTQFLFLLLFTPVFLSAQGLEMVFEDAFASKLKPGWTWIREKPDSWRMTQDALEIRVEPGNMWGGSNNAVNVLVRPLEEADQTELQVTLENRPTEQYEQIDLVWYYDDGHMVKIGLEQVDGQWSVVMGREEKDRTRTVCIIPVSAHKLDFRFMQSRQLLEGFYRVAGETEWTKAGECDLPVHGRPHVSLQAYQGPATAVHWARIQNLVIRQASIQPNTTGKPLKKERIK